MTLISKITRVIWKAEPRVGKRRTNPADVARILWEHGATCGESLTIVERHVAESIPVVKFDIRLAGELNRELAAFADCGYGLSDAKRISERGGRVGGSFVRVIEIDRELIQLHAANNHRSLTVEQLAADWWKSNRSEIRSICRTVAESILERRGVLIPADSGFCSLPRRKEALQR